MKRLKCSYDIMRAVITCFPVKIAQNLKYQILEIEGLYNLLFILHFTYSSSIYTNGGIGKIVNK